MALDKTGTLTEGTPRVTDIRPLPGSGLHEDALLALAAAAEHPSEHPLARAVVRAARERGLGLARGSRTSPPPPAPGSPPPSAAAPSRSAPRPPAGTPPAGPGHPRAAQALEDEGRTAVLVLRDGTPVGVLGIADRLRPDAAATVAALTELTGSAPVLLTGDNERAAARLAAEVGITDVRAGLLPQDKVAASGSGRTQGAKVLVVGDGVNDAPALAAAHTGIAMGRPGSDLALQTADAVVVRDELATIPAVVALSRAARRLVVQNLVIAGIFITVLVIWDLIGHAAPAAGRRRPRGLHRHRRPQRPAPAARRRLAPRPPREPTVSRRSTTNSARATGVGSAVVVHGERVPGLLPPPGKIAGVDHATQLDQIRAAGAHHANADGLSRGHRRVGSLSGSGFPGRPGGTAAATSWSQVS